MVYECKGFAVFRILGNIDEEMRGRRRLDVGGTKQVKEKDTNRSG